MKVMVRVIFCFTLIFGALSSSHAMGQLFMFENPLVGDKVPDFTLKTVDGKQVNLAKFRENQNTIIFFWATWCPHCREQLQQLTDHLGDEIQKKGIKILLVDVGETAGQVRAYVKKYKVPYEVILDEDDVISEKYNIVGVPTFFFIDKEGMVRSVDHSIADNYEEMFATKK